MFTARGCFAWLAALCCGLVLLALVPQARAQSRGFEKVTAVKFFIADFSEAGAACGLSKPALEKAFMAPAEAQGLQVSDSSSYWVYIRATTLLYGEKSCVTNIDAAAFVETRYFSPATLDERLGRVELWAKSDLLISDKRVHAVVVNNAFRESGRDFLGRWQRDQ